MRRNSSSARRSPRRRAQSSSTIRIAPNSASSAAPRAAAAECVSAMPTAVTLDLDDAGASRIEPLWDALERDATLPTTRRLGVRPHLSLAVYDALAPTGCRRGSTLSPAP